MQAGIRLGSTCCCGTVVCLLQLCYIACIFILHCPCIFVALWLDCTGNTVILRLHCNGCTMQKHFDQKLANRLQFSGRDHIPHGEAGMGVCQG